MSYEGRYQSICKKGHYSEYPEIYDKYDHICSCGEPEDWSNAVDETNCDDSGVIPAAELARFLVSPVVLKTCPTCNHSEIAELAVYRVPTPEETRSMQHYYETAADGSRSLRKLNEAP